MRTAAVFMAMADTATAVQRADAERMRAGCMASRLKTAQLQLNKRMWKERQILLLLLFTRKMFHEVLIVTKSLQNSKIIVDTTPLLWYDGFSWNVIIM